MKKLLFVFACLTPMTLMAQPQFKGYFINNELNLRLTLDLYEQTVSQPQFDEEKCFGVLEGALNGHWVFLKIESLDETVAVVRAVSDSGIEAQSLELKLTEEGIEIKQVKGANIRGVKNRKYVKLPKNISFKRR